MIPKDIDQRLNSLHHCPPNPLQVHKGRVHHLNQNIGHSPHGYNRHGGGKTGITLCLGCVADSGLDLDTSNCGVNLNLDVVVISDLDLHIQNGGFQYQKVAHHPVNIGSGERPASELVNLPGIYFD